MVQNETRYRFCLIIGAGASGLLQGAELIKQGILKHNEFEIIERNSGYGGVWWQSTYPGAACDIVEGPKRDDAQRGLRANERACRRSHGSVASGDDHVGSAQMADAFEHPINAIVQ